MDATADPQPDEWGPFGRPLFDDPSARALKRVGVIDVGSNSVRLVVFDGAARSPADFFNEKVMCGLGADMARTGRLHPQGRIRALAALRRFAVLTRAMEVSPIRMVATAAVRDAEDGPAFRAEVEAVTGLRMAVIDGNEEARLSAQGVLLGWPDADGLVCDIGGSSMELAVVENGSVGRRLTSPLGPLRIEGVARSKTALKEHLRQEVEKLAEYVGASHRRLYLVGGSWRAIARIDMARRDYPLHVLHEYRMSPREIQRTVGLISETDSETLRNMTGNSAARMALVHTASRVLKALMKRFSPAEVCVSAYGIREGMLYEQMPERMRRRDPLIEATRFAEQKDARLPGFGKKLYQFLLPLFRNAPPARLRLIRAACSLHDVNWRVHADYRARMCFDTTTRANLGGLAHSERVFLALALLHRYKNSRSGAEKAGLLDLLTPAQVADAEVLGKAMRFGSMLATHELNDLARLEWRPRKKVMHLILKPEAADLFGEVAQSRFRSLAQALDAQTDVTMTVPRGSRG